MAYDMYGNQIPDTNQQAPTMQGWNNPVRPAQQVPQMPPPRHNKLIVTSLEEAMARPADPNTVITYFHQDGNVEYEVYTDFSNYKRYRILDRKVREENTPAPNAVVSRQEFDELKQTVVQLINKEVHYEPNANVPTNNGTGTTGNAT